MIAGPLDKLIIAEIHVSAFTAGAPTMARAWASPSAGGIVERHHGAITARSKPGQGATFIITLPETQSVD